MSNDALLNQNDRDRLLLAVAKLLSGHIQDSLYLRPGAWSKRPLEKLEALLKKLEESQADGNTNADDCCKER